MAGSIEGVRKWDLLGELDCYSDTQLTNFLELAACYVHEETFDCVAPGTADKACNLLTAHLILSMSLGFDAASGQVTAEAAGGLSRSYSAISGFLGNHPFASTSFGRLYLQLCAGIPTTGLVVGA